MNKIRNACAHEQYAKTVPPKHVRTSDWIAKFTIMENDKKLIGKIFVRRWGW